MSAIQQYLDDIKTAVYGEEVRGSIHDAIEQCYEDVTAAKTIADDSVRDMADTVANAKIDINNTRDAGVQAVNEAKTTAVQTVNQTKTTALDDIQDKIDDATEDLDAVKQAASDAEAYAKGTRKGSAVPDTDPAYQNNAKYFYEQTSQNLIDSRAAKTATEDAKDIAVEASDTAVQAKNDIDTIISSKSDAIEKTVSGNIVTFDDAIPDTLLKKIKVNIDPVQAGSGDPSPNNVRPITGWTGVKVFKSNGNLIQAVTSAMGISSHRIRGYLNSGAAYMTRLAVNLPAGTYTVSYMAKKGSATEAYALRVFASEKGVTGDAISFSNLLLDDDVTNANNALTDEFQRIHRTFTVESKITAIYIGNQQSTDNYVLYDENYGYMGFKLEKGELSDSDGDVTIYNVEFPTEAGNNGTVYGGTLTLNDDGTGELVVTHLCEDGGNLTWTKITGNDYRNFSTTVARPRIYKADIPTVLSSNYKSAANNIGTGASKDNYVWAWANSTKTIAVKDTSKAEMTAEEFKTAMAGVQFIYELYTPLHYTLTAPQVKTLLGENNIFADTGAVEVTYRQSAEVSIRDLAGEVTDEKLAEIEPRHPHIYTATLTADNWTDNKQTVEIEVIDADETKQIIEPIPANASLQAYTQAGVMAINQYAGQLEFSCNTVPTDNLTVYVVVTEVMSE